MSKKKLIEATGKEDSLEPTTLEQIMGFNELSRYNTIEASVYENTLSDMNRTDLESEARRVGAIIVEDTQRLREGLKKEFVSYVSTLKKPRHQTRPIQISKEVEAILKEGR
jgi:hypothetical protein